MRITNIIILVFLLGAFAIGITLSEHSSLTPEDVSEILDSSNITRIELNRVSEPVISYTNNIIVVVESFVRFVIVFAIETFKLGIGFGYDNPDYFEPSFIIFIIKWIVILVIVSLLIKPLFYVVVLLILFGIWIKEIIEKKKRRRALEKRI